MSAECEIYCSQTPISGLVGLPFHTKEEAAAASQCQTVLKLRVILQTLSSP